MEVLLWKKHLLKKEWEAYIQDYKNSGLSKVAWCQKQNLPITFKSSYPN
ncbi:IS66 family insertion sequence element accessory protein TnpA [Bacillus sp. CGMCC 1.60114]